MATVSANPAIDTLHRSMTEARFDDLRAVLTDNVVLDANVPQWHFLRVGADDVVAQFQEWYPVRPTELTWDQKGTGGAVVVECTERKLEQGAPGYSRFALVLELSGDKLSRVALYCFGVQDRETEERNRQEAPLY
jgi:hypothetical protein